MIAIVHRGYAFSVRKKVIEMTKDKAASSKARWYFIQRNYHYDTHDDKGNLTSNITLQDWCTLVAQQWGAVSGVKMCASILHNRDVDSDGKLVQPHLHALVNFNNPRAVGGVMQDFGLSSESNCQQVKDVTSVARYMLHITDDALVSGKTIYGINEIVMLVGQLSDFDAVLRKPLKSNGVSYHSNEENTTFVDELSAEVREGRLSPLQAESALIQTGDMKQVRKYRDTFARELKYRMEYLFDKSKRGEFSRELTLVYFEGRGGAGKSLIARKLGGLYMDGFGIHSVAAPGQDITYDFVGGYKGEKITIADEVKTDVFDVRQFLDMFDRHKIPLVASRNYDKPWYAEYCFFTNSMAFDSWMKHLIYHSDRMYRDKSGLVELAKDKETQDVCLQVRRRFKFYVKMNYDESTGDMWLSVSKLRNDFTGFDVIATIPHTVIDKDNVPEAERLAVLLKEVFDAHN